MSPVEQALDVALVVMKNGGSTRLADRTFRNVLRGCGHPGVTVVWRLDMVMVHDVAAEGPVATVLRPVGPIGVQLVRVSEAAVLGEQVARGEVAPDTIGPEVARIGALGASIGRVGMILAAAGTAAFFSKIVAGDWGAFGLALVAAASGQSVRFLLQPRKIPALIVTLACGLLSAGLAALGLRLGLSRTVPAALIASVIYMVPGLPLINGFLDMTSQKYLLVGLERIAHAVLVFLALAIAIVLAHAAIR